MEDPLSLWHVGPMKAELRRARLGEGDVLVRTLWSLISRGTERLVFEGRVPESEWARMRAPMQEGDFPFPVKYGYAAVGVVEDGPAGLVGAHVFALHPHQTHFRINASHLIPVPAGVPPRRAALAANMETALNALWDASAGPGDRIAVVGAGLVGLLVARLAARMPGVKVVIKDRLRQRDIVAAQLNVISALDKIDPSHFDIAVHTSASADGLDAALDCLGDEGTLIELSWYGSGAVSVRLGGAFHSKRLRLISSQVGRVSPSRRPRRTHAERLATAMALLDDPALDALIDEEVAFADLPARLPAILSPDATNVATIVRYE